jgi:16S rRNA (uracil1498-N3)-methyltransferase
VKQLFYSRHIADGFARFDEEESRHLLSVLRYGPGDRIQLTDGAGVYYEAEITESGKKMAVARILEQKAAAHQRPHRLHVAIAPTKNIDRFEWFLEKATEIGINDITPLHCKRSERDALRYDRLEKVLVSAMKQSYRATLPTMHPLTAFPKFIAQAQAGQKRIAWCDGEQLPHIRHTLNGHSDILLLIGPEGDFTEEEVKIALAAGYQPINLGPARLRTETAGLLVVAAAALLLD